jgi:hypothetical protein
MIFHVKESFEQSLQGMENTLTQQWKPCPAIAHPFDQFELVHLSFNQTIVLGERESCHDCRFVSFYSQNKAL